MITVIKVSFGSRKIYTYRLAPESVVKPKAGDRLMMFSGASRSGARYVPLNVVGVDDVDSLPSIVSKQIRVVDRERHCTSEVIAAKPVKTEPPKPSKANMELYRILHKIFFEIKGRGSDGSSGTLAEIIVNGRGKRKEK